MSDLYVLGGQSATDNAPGMHDPKNNTQCPFPSSFETNNGGMMKMKTGRILNLDQMLSGAVDCGAPVSVVG